MPVKDCMTGSPYCPEDKYQEFHDPVLSEHESIKTKEANEKHHFMKNKGEHNHKIQKFAENLKSLRHKSNH